MGLHLRDGAEREGGEGREDETTTSRRNGQETVQEAQRPKSGTEEGGREVQTPAGSHLELREEAEDATG